MWYKGVCHEGIAVIFSGINTLPHFCGGVPKE